MSPHSVTASSGLLPLVAGCFTLFLAAICPLGAAGGECRQGAASATRHCALPAELGNFQGYYLCAEEVKIGRPHNKAELAEQVAHFSRVKGVGVGHSWWGSQFCSGNDSDSINIVTTELDTTLDLILDPVYYNASMPAPTSWPIQVDEGKKTVTAAAGVPQRILLDSLDKYTSDVAPDGYAIAAFPWYIDQTIAGAISTGTHGSSFQYGSISSQTVRIEMALANGTLANFTKASNPQLWNAAQIAVGRLGVITEVELSIIPQDMVERQITTTSFWDFVDAMQVLQDDYNGAVNGTGDQTVAEVLASYEGTQIFWFVPTNKLTWLKYKGLERDALAEFEGQDGVDDDEEEEPVVATASIAESPVDTSAPTQLPLAYQPADAELAPGPFLDAVFAQVPSPALGKVPLPATNPMLWNTLQSTYLAAFLTNGTFSRRDSILAETEFVNRATSDTDPYDQYEFSIRLEDIGDCMEEVGRAMYEDDLLLGFPVPPLIRFVGEEDAFLSNANGGPRIFFNIEDHQSYQTGEPNARFDALVEVLRGSTCQARMHWGKAGWDKWAPCFDGATEYAATWCSFGCAAKALDPDDKFASESNVWTWSATKDGDAVPFEECCDGDGFSPACTCAPREDCAA